MSRVRLFKKKWGIAWIGLFRVYYYISEQIVDGSSMAVGSEHRLLEKTL